MKAKGRIERGPGPSFGAFLRARREERALTIADVSRMTRLTENTISLLEREELALLPPPVFVRGFVAAYAEAVGADRRAALEMCLAAIERASPPEEGRFQVIRAAAWILRLGVLAAFTMLVAVLVLMVCLPGGDSAWDPGGRSAVLAPAAQGPHDRAAAPALRLAVTCQGDTWIRVMADGVERGRFDMRPGQRMSLAAARSFNILVGNPEAVRVTLNGKPVTLSGRPGQAVNLRLP